MGLNHAIGQITLDVQDFGNVGDEVQLYSDTTYLGAISTGTKGPAQFWNFPFSFHSLIDTVGFIDPSLTPNGNSFPNSNLALKEQGALTFLKKDNSGVQLLGFSLDLDTFFSDANIKISPPLNFLNFPTQYGNNFSSTGTGSVTFPFQDTISIGGPATYVDSVRVDFIATLRDSVNGYGVLSLDSSNINALRIESWQNISLDIFIKVEIIPGFFVWVPVPIPIFPDK